MGAPSVGDVVIIPFPYSDLSQSKRRPALVLAEAGIRLSLRWLKRDGLIRGAKLFTANEALILGVAGYLTHSKLSEVICQLIEILSARLKMISSSIQIQQMG